MAVRVTFAGPLFDGTASRVVLSELRSANEQAAATVRVAANRAVHRDLGTYERGWRPLRHQSTGGDTFFVSTLENTAPNAAVMETGREPGHHTPIAPLIAWAERRGYSGKDAQRVAYGAERNMFKYGWPNIGSYRGGQYLGPPKPVETALDREDAQVNTIYQQMGARIARRIS